MQTVFLLLATTLATLCSATPLSRTLQIRQRGVCRWNVSYIDYAPSIPLVNFVFNRPDDAEPYTLCTGNFSSTPPTWQSCSYYQFANGSKSGNLNVNDAQNLRWRVPVYSATPGSESVDIQITNGVREASFGFNSKNLQCVPGRGGTGEQCFLKGTP